MGFMDELKKLTQPYDDEGEYIEGEDEQAIPQAPKQKVSKPSRFKFTTAQDQFEQAFADAASPRPEEAPAKKVQSQESGGIFGGSQNNHKKMSKPRNAGRDRGAGRDASVIIFSPKSFDEAGELVSYMLQKSPIVMTLEGVQGDMARRLLDFISGIAFALQGRITPISAKTYYITPDNIGIVANQSEQSEQPESYGHYF